MLNDDYVIGFFEGEGCFTATKSRNGACIYYPKIIIVNTNRELLEAIRDYLGVGNVYRHSESCDGWHRKKAWQLQIFSLSDCIKMVSFFEGKLLTKEKIDQFNTFKNRVATSGKRYVYCGHCRKFLKDSTQLDGKFCKVCHRKVRNFSYVKQARNLH